MCRGRCKVVIKTGTSCRRKAKAREGEVVRLENVDVKALIKLSAQQTKHPQTSKQTLCVRPLSAVEVSDALCSLKHSSNTSLHSQGMPSLPPELWDAILRFATELPGSFDTAYQSPVDHPWTFDQDNATNSFKQRHAPIFDTKRNIVLVCRVWNALATRYLYETIVIKDKDAVVLLARTLKHGGFGRYIIRLEIAALNTLRSNELAVWDPRRWGFRGTTADDPEFTDSEASSVAEVFLHTPNLCVLCIEDFSWMRACIERPDEAGRCWFPSLRSLVWRLPLKIVSLETDDLWVSRMAPGLEILGLTHVNEGSAWHTRHPLPNLHTLVLDHCSNYTSVVNSAPELKHIGYDPHTIRKNRERHPPVHAVTIWDRHGLNTEEVPWYGDNINQHCEELLLHINSDISPRGTYQIRRVGIVFELFNWLRDQFLALTLEGVELPYLEVIRVHFNAADPRSWDEVRTTRRFWVFFAHWAKVWNGRGVRLEDSDGILLSIRLTMESIDPPRDGEYEEYDDWQ